MFNKASLFSALVLTASLVHARPGPAWVRRQENAQTSFTLDPAVISQGLAQDGQGNNPDPGQVRSETSTNNFINHCLKFLDQGVPLTDGKQITGGSCNQTPMGRIISLDKAPRSKFVFPKNGDESIAENTPFTVQMRMVNMVAGNFVNAQANYYAAPQQVDGNGILIGHSHIVIEPIPSFDSTEPLDPLAFKFFKGLNDPADGQGILKTEVTAGLPKGFYRMCSINTAANHQPALVSNAQHGALDDCSYFGIGQRQNQNGNGGGNSNNGNVASSSTEAGSTTASGSAAPESTQTNSNGGQQGNSNGGQQGNPNGGQGNSGASTEAPGSTSAPAPEPSQSNPGQSGNNDQQGNGNGNSGAPTETPSSTPAPAPAPSQGNNGQQGNNSGAPTETPGSTPAPAPEPSQSQPSGNGEQGQGQGNQSPEQGNIPQQGGNPSPQPSQSQNSPAPENQNSQPGQGQQGPPEQNQGQQPSQGQADPTAPPQGQGSQRRRSHNGRQ